jgi:hypothetical protein
MRLPILLSNSSGAPSRHVRAAFCCIAFAICVSCKPMERPCCEWCTWHDALCHMFSLHWSTRPLASSIFYGITSVY